MPSIPIFIILLERDLERVNHVNNNLKPLLEDPIIFPAIDGKTDQIESIMKRENLEISNSFKEKALRGQIGCYLSHYLLWKHIVDSNISEAIIFEDDANITDTFYNSLNKIKEELPVDYKFLYL